MPLQRDHSLSHKPGNSAVAPSTAIVIVAHGRADSLRVLLEDIAAGMLPAPLQEIVIVENGSSDCGSAEVCANWDIPIRLTYAFQQDSRKSAALNFAISIATARFIIFFDDDIRIGKTTIQSYIEAAVRYGSKHHFGGRLIATSEQEAPDYLKRYLPESARGFDRGEMELIVETPDLLGANWAAFRADLLAAGGYPQYLGPGTAYGASGSETIMQSRLLHMGSKAVYLPNALAIHHVPRGNNDFQFACRRSRNYGLSMTLADFVEGRKPAAAWPPRWMLRRALELWLCCSLARLKGRDIRDRVEREIALANVRGALAAYLVLRKHPQVLENRPIFRDIRRTVD